MDHAQNVCSTRKLHTTTWSKSIGRDTHAIRYWDILIKRKGGRDENDGMLNYYLARSNVDVEGFDKILPLSDCHRQAKNARAKLKDIVTDAKENGTSYELEVAIARVHKRHPELCDDPSLEVEREDRIANELKTRENRRTAARSYRKLGRQIRGHVKPNSIKKLFLTSLELPGEDELWF
jgi:hypothetical protein